MSERKSEVFYTPTESERGFTARLALVAAHNAFATMCGDRALPNISKATIAAFCAAKECEATIRKLIEDGEGKSSHQLIYDFRDIVASAWVAFNGDGPDEVHPHSIAGTELGAFVDACIAVETMSRLPDFSECEQLEWGAKDAASYYQITPVSVDLSNIQLKDLPCRA
jgi:hypothetical protein